MADFGEMYIGCRLLEEGKLLLPVIERQREGGQPDICVLDEGRRIWIEAIAPGPGAAGPDEVRGPIPMSQGGGFEPAPTRQAQLRITSALLTKSQAVNRYLDQGVIRSDDVRLVAIGASRFGAYVLEHPLPLVMSSVFPIGKQFVSFDVETGVVINKGFQSSFEIARQGPAIPRTAFLDEKFSQISGIVWSRVGIGNMRRAERPLTLVHNPLAATPMPQSWGVWDREFVAEADGDHWTVTDILAPASD